MAATRTGSCLCGQTTYECGEPAFTAICHCHDCAKISSAPVHQVPKTSFRITSSHQPKEFTMKSDHGREITSHFCPNCGTTLYRTGGAPQVADFVGLRTGTLDDQSEVRGKAVMMEVYVDKRAAWKGKVEGAMQMDSKYETVKQEGEAALSGQ